MPRAIDERSLRRAPAQPLMSDRANVDSKPEHHQQRQHAQQRWAGLDRGMFAAQMQRDRCEKIDKRSRNHSEPDRSGWHSDAALDRGPSAERRHHAVLTTFGSAGREQRCGARRLMLLAAGVVHDLLHRAAVDVATSCLCRVQKHDQRKQCRSTRRCCADEFPKLWRATHDHNYNLRAIGAARDCTLQLVEIARGMPRPASVMRP